VLLLPPFVGLLYPPFYARLDPRWVGLPFFLWYQFAWVIVTALLTGLVYVLRRPTGAHEDYSAGTGPGETSPAGGDQ
jgi:hypothetical protein